MKVIYIKWFDSLYNNDSQTTKEVQASKEAILESVGILSEGLGVLAGGGD